MKYPVYRPELDGNEKKYAIDCFDSNWISSKGKYVNKFERSFAKYIGISFASSVCNGTAALHCALLALGIGKGDEIIVPTLTYIAAVNAIKFTGAKPVFVDALRDTWQIDPYDVSRKINQRTKAILCVHLYGLPCDMDSLKLISKENNLFLIEDCAEAFGSFYNTEHVGTFGDIAIFSFYGNKTMTTGEGGMVVSNNKYLIEKVQKIKGQGLKKGTFYEHDIVGYNYRMTNICAAIGLAQLENVDRKLQKKRQIAKTYFSRLNNIEIEFQKENDSCHNSYWMFSILILKEGRDELIRKLLLDGIETRPIFKPIHLMPMYFKREYIGMFQNAIEIAKLGINLPSYPGLTDLDLKYISSKVLFHIDKM